MERTWNVDAERWAFAQMDIGLMPLVDTPWSRGKCAYKALQYMASGIPAVVDDVGISAEVVRGSGFIATGEKQWVEALLSLAGDLSLRVRLGRAGRERMNRIFPRVLAPYDPKHHERCLAVRAGGSPTWPAEAESNFDSLDTVSNRGEMWTDKPSVAVFERTLRPRQGSSSYRR